MDRIDALRLFTRLARHGSFSAAAKDLNIKQSTASKWVAELESELGSRLVLRTTRSVRITDIGRHFLAKAENVLAAFDDMKDELAEHSPEPAGRIRLSVPVVFGRLFVVPAVADFLTRHRQVHANMVFDDRYVNLVEDGFDLAIRVGIPADTSAHGWKLADSDRVLVASPSYLDSRGRPLAPEDLGEHECLVRADTDAAAVWRFGRTAGSHLPATVRSRFAANNSEVALLMAVRGLGIALLPDWLVEDDLRQGRLLPLLGEFTAPPAPIHALTPPGRFKSPTIRALIAHLAAALQAGLHPCNESGRRHLPGQEEHT
ncbi:MAG TPA: LysR family transcriptional regulator [Myxococcales bacterium]